MPSKKEVYIKISDDLVYLKQNEFWYFRNMLKKISNYFNKNENQSKSVLVKIPGTGEFKKIDYFIFNSIVDEVDKIVSRYKHEFQI